MSKDHAEHNEKLCDILFSDGNFNDWVVTTAFYSCIHFVESKLFPLTISKHLVYVNIIDAKKLMRSSSPHAARKSLVSQFLPEISGDYGFLDSVSRTARYHDYQISKEKASKARERLQNVKQICSE